MDRASRDEDAVALLGYERCDAVRHDSTRDRPPEIVGCGARLQAGIDTALRPGFEHDPCFGLAGFAGRQQVLAIIRGMHLEREQLAHVEELEQQREAAETSGQPAEHLLRIDAPVLHRGFAP